MRARIMAALLAVMSATVICWPRRRRPIYGTTGYTEWMWVQDQGCGNTAVYPTEAFYWHNDIRYIRVHLCEIDRAGGGWKHGDCAYSIRKDNPHT